MSHRLYSHDQKTGKVKEMSALSTSRTEIPLNKESRQFYGCFFFLNSICDLKISIKKLDMDICGHIFSKYQIPQPVCLTNSQIHVVSFSQGP